MTIAVDPTEIVLLIESGRLVGYRDLDWVERDPAIASWLTATQRYYLKRHGRLGRVVTDRLRRGLAHRTDFVFREMSSHERLQVLVKTASHRSDQEKRRTMPFQPEMARNPDRRGTLEYPPFVMQGLTGPVRRDVREFFRAISFRFHPGPPTQQGTDERLKRNRPRLAPAPGSLTAGR